MDSPLGELTESSLLLLDHPSHDPSSFLGTFEEDYPAGIETNIIASHASQWKPFSFTYFSTADLTTSTTISVAALNQKQRAEKLEGEILSEDHEDQDIDLQRGLPGEYQVNV
jgi:hypothetical protein